MPVFDGYVDYSRTQTRDYNRLHNTKGATGSRASKRRRLLSKQSRKRNRHQNVS